MPGDVRELNGWFTRQLHHFYFCPNVTSERGTDVLLSGCSERQNKASTGTANNKRKLGLCLERVCVCVYEIVCVVAGWWQRRPSVPTCLQEEAYILVNLIQVVQKDNVQLIVGCFTEGTLHFDIISRGNCRNMPKGWREGEMVAHKDDTADG